MRLSSFLYQFLSALVTSARRSTLLWKAHRPQRAFAPALCLSIGCAIMALAARGNALAGETAQAGPPTAIERCNNKEHILPPGNINTDLQIDGVSCTVDGSAPAGTYIYRNVNIWGGGTLSFADAKIDFHAHSILVENQGSLLAGVEAAAKGPISIWLYGTERDDIPAITCKSSATCGVPADMWNSNPGVPMHHKTNPGDKCEPASKYGSSPLGDECFYQYEVFDDGDGPGTYFGKKVLALSYGGRIYLRGAKGIRPASEPIDATPSDSGTSWVRLATDLKQGQESFHVDRAVPTWEEGDHIVITTTDYLPGHSEEAVIQKLTSDATGTVITLKQPVGSAHNGTAYNFSSLPGANGPRKDPDGPATLLPRHLETRAAVALLTRSIMISSEGREPVQGSREVDHFPGKSFFGGQTLMREGFANYQVQGVEFFNLGQGGVIGRYPVHFHMDRKVPQPIPTLHYEGTYIADSSIHESMTRFITVHATQGVLAARNVGFRSIGHGFYLEDATEINNRLYSNIGIESRAALDDDLNPRKVPGILARPGQSGAEVFPFHSDYDHPSIFWITNTWNDLRYNVAVGAGSCGACYWMPPSVNSGPSLYETWDSYASMQTAGRGGITPMENFTGNSCSAAMNSLETVSNTSPCFGVVASDAPHNSSTLRAIENPNPLPTDAYPQVNGDLRQHATVCPDASTPGSDCSKVPICDGSGPNEALCAVTTIDHYTTSFNWAQKNFAAVWLRGWWYLFRDSAVTDAQGGGLTFITGGGYTRSDAAQGFWNLSQRVLFVGNTQPIRDRTGVPDNPYASNAGPFNPDGLPCAYGNPFCISRADDVSFQIDTFGGAQRMISIYDGPSFEDSDAFMDIHTTDVGSLGQCKPGGGNPAGSCHSLGWMNAHAPGVMQVPATNNPENRCVLPNAAIAWKQPNGFYYPPAFHSYNLAFQNVDIRHFVIQPLWEKGSFNPDLAEVKKTYCTWEPGDFGNFTDVDRQTELSDDNGSITGLLAQTPTDVEPPTDPVPGNPPGTEASISITKDPFFNAPLVTPECASSIPDTAATVDTSPYEYVTTALFPECAGNGGSCEEEWSTACTSQACTGVPLYRQYLTDDEYKAYKTNSHDRPAIRMMGQSTGQRSTLTINHGSYYIDSTNAPGARTSNRFLPSQSYFVYLLYATPKTHQTYNIYIGRVAKEKGEAAVVPGTVDISDAAYKFKGSTADNWITKTYDPETGILSVTIDLKAQGNIFATDRNKFCQPQTYCGVQDDGSCGCARESGCTDPSVCAWSNKEIDCPIRGCFGFSVTMPAEFSASQTARVPAPIHYVGDPQSDDYFTAGNVKFFNVNQTISGPQCHYPTAPVQKDKALERAFRRMEGLGLTGGQLN